MRFHCRFLTGDRCNSESLEARRVQARAELLALKQEIRKEVDQVLDRWAIASGVSFEGFQKEIIERTEENFKLLEAAYREKKRDSTFRKY